MRKRGILIVVSGFSGSGKGTLMKELLSNYSETYALSVSATTRKPRAGEQEGREYFFKTKDEFEKMIAKEELIEYAKYVENYYGTPRAVSYTHLQQLVSAGALGRLPFIQVDSLEKDSARVVFQGVEGAYGQAAMQKYFGKNVNSFHVRTFRDAMEAIEEGAADYAVLPIENSSAGAVNEMYDLLDEFENYIVAETVIPITNTLAGVPGASLTDIKRVYSKAEALMQTSRFLDKHADWQQISVVNTAIAAKKILEDRDKTQAAVCSAYRCV